MILAGLSGGCASRGGALTQLDGSEPQRLSFGDPKTVQAHFADKVRACWFGGAEPALQGYHLDETALAVAADVPPKEVPALNIRIFSNDVQPREAFQVEFHAFNDNTLISTRNISMPTELAGRLKRDVEIWMFGDKGCGAPAGGPVALTSRPSRAAPALSARFQNETVETSAHDSALYEPALYGPSFGTGGAMASAGTPDAGPSGISGR